MAFFTTIVKALIFICFMALVYFLAVWVMASIGFTLPPMVMKIVGVIFILICILILARLFMPWASGFDWLGTRGPHP